MKEMKRPMIAVLMGDNYTEYANELIKGFYSCAKREGVNLVFLMRSSIPRDTNAILSGMTGDDFRVYFSSIYDYVPLTKPDALIVAFGSLSIFSDTPKKEELFEYFKGIPCMLLKDISDEPAIPSLVADNYAGMQQCIRHLIEVHDYKKIAFMGGPETNHDSNERLRAYRDVMQEHGLTVTDKMVIHGDYSELVEPLVHQLLDENPGLEAIAFANDNMAKAGYRVCEERGLVVGQDLAITGFDDVSFAKTMNPPLTSVMHNSFQFSYRAIQNAIQLVKGGEVPYSTLPTVLYTRGSCGCNAAYGQSMSKRATKEELTAFVTEKVTHITEEFFFSMPYQEEKEEYRGLLLEFFDKIIEPLFGESGTKLKISSLYPCLKKLCKFSRISPMIVLDHIVSLVRGIMTYEMEYTVRDVMQRTIVQTQQYVNSHVIHTLQEEVDLNKHQNWFVNSFTKDLRTTDLSIEESLQRIMSRLQMMNIKSCYFFMLSEPVVYEKSFRLRTPDNLYLAAYYNSDAFVQFKREKWIHIDGEQALTQMLSTKEAHVLTSYVLFSDNTQYGIMLCENEPSDILFTLQCSMQIGSFLSFYHLNTKEHEIRTELEASLNLIKEQNSILNFISEYDELTGMLNRRGFMENALHVINENAGKKAYVLFGDLDHLKEINDTFGHAAGDEALKTVAGYLKECLPKDAVIGRIGGDEFAGFIVAQEDDFTENTKQALKEYGDNYNKNSAEPYYVEMSIGIYQCRCDSSASITDLLKESDTLLYEEKAKRRKSAKK